jgi:hypothetical protein
MQKNSVAKPEGKRELERPCRRWEHNIKTDFEGICWENVDWFHIAQDRYAREHVNKILSSTKGVKVLDYFNNC